MAWRLEPFYLRSAFSHNPHPQLVRSVARYPKMLVISDQSHLGIGQLQTYQILEKLSAKLNSQGALETLLIKEYCHLR